MRARETQLVGRFWLRYPETIFIVLFFFSSSLELRATEKAVTFFKYFVLDRNTCTGFP